MEIKQTKSRGNNEETEKKGVEEMTKIEEYDAEGPSSSRFTFPHSVWEGRNRRSPLFRTASRTIRQGWDHVGADEGPA